MICPPDLVSLPKEARAAHAAECPVCRLELDLASAPDAPCDDERVQRLVDGALSDFARAPSRRARTTRFRWTLLAAAALVVGAAAAASLLRGRGHEPTVSPRAPVAPPSAVAIAAPPETAAPTVVSIDDLPRAPTPTVVTTATASDDWTSASLFATANAERRRGDHADAISHYRLLARRFPTSEEAATARLSLALLLLDQLGDAQGALVELDRYLQDQPHGSLREESLATRARALGKLGRRDEEKKAWSDLLREYPDTLHRETARTRMGD